MMHIQHLDPQPFARLAYLNAGKRGGSVNASLPWLLGVAHTSAASHLDALLITSDLQGVVRDWHTGHTRLLGEAVAGQYLTLAQEGLCADPARVGVILAGDLYAAPGGDIRGASGPVEGVWRAFAAHFAWAVGVVGNHDTITEPLPENAHLLDLDYAPLSGLEIAGLGGVIGDPRKPQRRSEQDYLAGVEVLLAGQPDVLVLHTPPHLSAAQRGEERLKPLLAGYGGLMVCGHIHWDAALAGLGAGQVLNVEGRVVYLELC